MYRVQHGPLFRCLVAAGYSGNSRPIPVVPQSCNIKTDYGAAGDGIQDDTQVGGSLKEALTCLLRTESYPD